MTQVLTEEEILRMTEYSFKGSYIVPTKEYGDIIFNIGEQCILLQMSIPVKNKVQLMIMKISYPNYSFEKKKQIIFNQYKKILNDKYEVLAKDRDYLERCFLQA